MLSNKKGSALLIVIGFLSFMIVSAVAFSIYMRAERMPSSALRRTVATRQLAKAALAEAIARVDDAVRGAPFPGLNDSTSGGYQPRGAAENHWEGRVFMPPNLDYRGGNELYYAPAPLTVSVLTLEGMGYVPPPLVNDARFLGRSTWTAAWQNLPYDAGRFAFVALNVSDYFDINRVYAGKPRTSNADGRISLAYMLDPNFKPMAGGKAGESMSVDGFSASAAKQFDNLLHDQRDGGNDNNSIGRDAPFVSDLDYQLAFKQGISGIMPSFFYEWIENKQVGKKYYRDEMQIANAGRQPFVTESVCTNESYEVDIAYYKNPSNGKNGQPFDKEVAQDNTTLMQIAMSKMASSQFFSALLKNMKGNIKFANDLGPLAAVASTMYDYLDHDDVPLSLAWPCVERVPSIVSLYPELRFSIPAIAAEGPSEKQDWYFNPGEWLQPGLMSTIWTFPFKRNDNDRNDTFKARALVRIFMAPEGLSLRGEALGAALRPQKVNDWTSESDWFKLDSVNNVFCISCLSDEKVINPSSKGTIIDDDQAGDKAVFSFKFDKPQKVSLVTMVKEKDPTTKKDIKKYTINISPLGLDGKPMFQVGQQLDEAQFNQITSEKTLRLYAAVWVRITNEDNKTVDLVPAVIEDDMVLNGGNSQAPTLQDWLLQSQDGPLLRFTGDKQFTYAGLVGNSGAAAATGQVEWTPKAFTAVDPRFNWAPEDWYCENNAITEFQQWLDKANNYMKQNNNCDRDIFLSVSNMGFLQSLGEFAFLPRLTDVDNGGGILMAKRQAGGGYDGKERWKAEEIANRNCAWMTYPMDYEVYSALEAAGIGRSTSRECLVNPYSPDWEIIMAALANSPCDYWSAGVALDDENKLKQTLGDSQLPKITDSNKGLEYAFSENKSMKGQARFRYKDLENIAKRIRDAMNNTELINQGRGHVPSRLSADAWKYIWDEDLDWGLWDHSGNKNNFLGIQLEQPLYGVDRKFLYSYWRDCFANQQQLFLIFVRAESSAIGGPGEGTPAQKGARAVALVWRNPAATTDTSTGPNGMQHDNNTGWFDQRRPHQTRVLFYHQFD